MKRKEQIKWVKNTTLNEIPEDELTQVNGGVNWKKFGQNILNNGGGNIPALYELVEAIQTQNWPLVAVIANSSSIKTIPVVIKSWNEAK